MHVKKLFVVLCTLILFLIANQPVLSETFYFRKVLWTALDGFIVTANENNVCIHDAENFDMVMLLDQSTSEISSMTLDNEHGQLITGHLDGTINFWDLGDGTIVETVNFYDLPVHDIEINDEGALLAITTRDERRAELWERKTLAVLTNLVDEIVCKFCSNPVFDMAFSPTDNILIVRSIDAFQDLENLSAIWLWDLQSNRVNAILDFPLNQTNRRPYSFVSMDFSPDGRFILGSDIRGFLVLWNIETEEFLGASIVHPREGAVRGVFSPTGDVLAVGGTALHVSEVTIDDSGLHLSEPIIVDIDTPVSSLAFNSVGDTLVTMNIDDQVIAWDVETGDQIADFEMCGKE